MSLKKCALSQSNRPNLSDADKALAEVLNGKGKSSPADFPKLVNPVIASYPNYGPARVMRLGGL
jgi:hypothetical protein